MDLRAVAVGVLTLLVSGCVKPSVTSAPLDLVVGRVEGREVEIAGTGSGGEKSSPTWDAKDEVDVEWRGRWWPATVLERRSSERYLVHYDGYGEEWDEVVGPERIRLRTVDAGGQSNDPVETDADP